MTKEEPSSPTLCKLQYWNSTTREWETKHHGINLLHPGRYAERLAKNGKIGRVVIFDTGEVLESEYPECEHCGEHHPGPSDGMCLL